MIAAKLEGRTFGQWLVVKRIPSNSKAVLWQVRCTCGVVGKVTTGALNAGQSTRCRQCMVEAQKTKKTHGLTNDPAYWQWRSIKRRCHQKFHQDYKSYGARGIALCKDWWDITVFYAWLTSQGWKPGMHVHRMDSRGDYEPSNCEVLSKEDHTDVYRVQPA